MITVQPGEVVINAIDVTAEGASFIVFEADCHTKRPVIFGVGSDEVLLGAGADTLKTDTGRAGQPTVIKLPPGIRGMHLVAEAARYTVRIVAWKPGTGKPRTVWQKP